MLTDRILIKFQNKLELLSHQCINFDKSINYLIIIHPQEGHQNVKLLYFKIKCLVDRGLILVGHSITKQLKYLNIHIPAQQYIDTAELYRPQHSGESIFSINIS